MKQYLERSIDKGGVAQKYLLEGSISISRSMDNTDYLQMLAEIEAGEAEIIPYVEPDPDYADLRRKAYASWGDQLDMQFHDSVDGTTTWVDHVAGVKAAHPKP